MIYFRIQNISTYSKKLRDIFLYEKNWLINNKSHDLSPPITNHVSRTNEDKCIDWWVLIRHCGSNWLMTILKLTWTLAGWKITTPFRKTTNITTIIVEKSWKLFRMVENHVVQYIIRQYAKENHSLNST